MLFYGGNKKEKFFYLYFLWSLIFLSNFKILKCQLKVFPESICQNDEIYTYANKVGTIDQIYKAGIYTRDTNAIYYSRKNGITYDKDNTCADASLSFTNLYTNSPFLSANNFFKNIYDSNEENQSNEYDLFKYSVGNQYSFQCNAPFPKIMNQNYKLSYRVAVLIPSSSNIKILFIGDNSNSITFNIPAQANEIKYLTFNITSRDSSDPTKRIMSFNYNGNTQSIIVSDKIKIKFQTSTSNNIYASNYIVTIQDTSTDKYATLNGERDCDDNNPCIPNYMCSGGLCKKCHQSCNLCSHDESISNSKSSCKRCNVLTFDNQAEGECPINYIDLHYFKDFDVSMNAIITHRVTMGLWVFISQSTAADTSFKIVITDFLILKITASSNIVEFKCTVFENLNRKYWEATYPDQELVISIPSVSQKLKMKNHSIIGHWFHVTCAMSFDHTMFYQTSVINGVTETNRKNLPYERLFGADLEKNDVYYRPIYEKNEVIPIHFTGFSNFQYPIFIKYFTVFQDFIPIKTLYMYYDFQNIASNDFPELSFLITFDRLYYGNDYKIKFKNFANNGNSDDIELFLKSSDFDVTGPLNFRELKLPETNKVYQTIDLKNEKSLSISANEDINYDDNKPIRCKFRMNYEDERSCSSGPCGRDSKGDQYIRYPGLENGNYCDYKCSPSMKCNDNYGENLDSFCEENDIYNMFYTCVDYRTEYYLQFSYFYHSKKFEFTIETELKSYIIELWFYPEILLQNVTDTLKHYIFHSNVISIFLPTSSSTSVKIQTSYGKEGTCPYHSKEWNKIIILVKFESNNIFKFNARINKRDVTLDYTTDDSKAILKTITFCNSCPGFDGTIYWTNGFYKNLRVWNGDLISMETIEDIDRLYSEDLIAKLTGCVAFYPLKGQYIVNNKITGIKGSPATTVASTGGTIIRKYNYGTAFDFVARVTPSLGKSLANSGGLSQIDCPDHCSRCWDTFNGNCFECFSGYFLKDGKCLSGSTNFLRVPSSTYAESLKINVQNLDLRNKPAVTVTFWIRPFAFADTIFQYSPDFCILKYDSSNINDKTKYGLSLLLGSTEDTTNTYAIDNNFRDKIGKWSFISLAYHKRVSESSKVFPNMLQLEINNETFGTDFSLFESTSPPVFGNFFIIPYSLYALIYQLKIYANYITGTYGFEMTTDQLTSPFTKPTPIGKVFFPSSNTNTGCYDLSDFVVDDSGGAGNTITVTTFSCEPDFDVNFNDSLKPKINCNRTCQNVCFLKNNSNACSCMNGNSHSQYLLKELNNPIKCKRMKYLNFAKTNRITVEGVSTAQATKKYTLQFWMYVYNYYPDNFDGLTVTWIGHNKIIIERTTGVNQYKYKCYAKTDESGLEGEDEIETTITVNKWNFISCAVDYTLNKLYLNVNIESGERTILDQQLGDTYYSSILSGDAPTNLIIEDNTSGNNEWGVLYFNQFRLWKEAYFNTDFLSRIEIKNTKLFPNLLNTWDTSYRNESNFENNFIVKEITLNNIDFTITYKTQVLGYNYVIDEKVVRLCSDSGEYYDITNDKCLNFYDVSKIDDITFTNVPYSYSGSYTMAFWIFLENAQSISAGIHITWAEIMQISILMDDNLIGYCFPQDYYTSKYSNDNIRNKYSDVVTDHLSAQRKILNDPSISDSGIWIYVTCAVSNYYETFYLIGNYIPEYEPKKLEHEILYVDDGNAVDSLYPMRYYLSTTEGSVKKTTLKIENLRNSDKIYFRNIQLFRDFIPKEYDIKYEDLTKITNTYMPSLVMVCNFVDIKPTPIGDKTNFTFPYKVFNIDTSSTTGRKYILSTLSTSTIANDSSFALSGNFIFLPLCDFTNNKKYDPDSNTCVSISCDNVNLHAQYCMDENKAMVCLDNYYINAEETVTCEIKCNSDTMRIPGTMETKGICSVPKPSGITTSFSSVATLSSYTTSVQCGSGTQIDYKCQTVDETKSALFYSRCYNPPNFYKTISNAARQKFASGYLLEFWFRFDHTLFFCDHENKEFYFFSTPHSIYLDYLTSTYYYAIINNPNYASAIEGISKYEWNKIVIRTTLGSTTGQNVIVYVN